MVVSVTRFIWDLSMGRSDMYSFQFLAVGRYVSFFSTVVASHIRNMVVPLILILQFILCAFILVLVRIIMTLWFVVLVLLVLWLPKGVPRL
jgi:hypothetical protein